MLYGCGATLATSSSNILDAVAATLGWGGVEGEALGVLLLDLSRKKNGWRVLAKDTKRRTNFASQKQRKSYSDIFSETSERNKWKKQRRIYVLLAGWKTKTLYMWRHSCESALEGGIGKRQGQSLSAMWRLPSLVWHPFLFCSPSFTLSFASVVGSNETLLWFSDSSLRWRGCQRLGSQWWQQFSFASPFSCVADCRSSLHWTSANESGADRTASIKWCVFTP